MEFKFWPKSFCTFFQGNPKELPLYVCIRGVQQKCVCEQVIRDAHGRRFRKNKMREAYVLSAKTGQSGLVNRNIRFLSTTRKTGTSGLENQTIWFSQTDHIDKRHAPFISDIHQQHI
jgi:hypothetical protein